MEVARLKLPRPADPIVARVQVFPEGANETYIKPWILGHPTEDYLTRRWWMGDEDRLEPWLWLDLLNDYMSLPRGTCWVDHLLFYPPPDGHELRPISVLAGIQEGEG